MVKTRIISLAVPETTAKESRITLSLWGFTIYVPPDLRFASDLVAFAKAPPGVRISRLISQVEWTHILSGIRVCCSF